MLTDAIYRGSRYRGPSTQLDTSVVRKKKEDRHAGSIKFEILITILVISETNIACVVTMRCTLHLEFTRLRNFERSFRRYFLTIRIEVENLFCTRKYISQIFYHLVQTYCQHGIVAVT